MLTQEQRDQLGVQLTKLAIAYGVDFPKEKASAFINSLIEFVPGTFDQYVNAIKSYVAEGNTFFPAPIKLQKFVNPEIDSRELAIVLARKIDRAVSKHGYGWSEGYYSAFGTYFEDDKGNKFPTFKEAVISELGDIGWHVICSRGGWVNIRNSANQMEEGTFIAQMRDQVQASYSLKKKGLDLTQIEMPKTKIDGLIASGNILKLITTDNGEA